jgi:type IV secretion system protein VirB11
MSALEDPEVIEIMCNPDGRLWVERYGHDQECIGDLSKAQIKLILSLTASALEMTVDKYNPIIEGEFPLDGSRFEGVYPPLVGPYPAFDIRKLASKIITLPEYVANGEMSQNASDIIEAAVLDRKNIVVVGGTSSGKTTFVNADRKSVV